MNEYQFYITKNSDSGFIQFFKSVPLLTLNIKSGRAWYRGQIEPTEIQWVYLQPSQLGTLNALNVPNGKCWKIEIFSDDLTTVFQVLDDNVKCPTEVDTDRT